MLCPAEAAAVEQHFLGLVRAGDAADADCLGWPVMRMRLRGSSWQSRSGSGSRSSSRISPGQWPRVGVMRRRRPSGKPPRDLREAAQRGPPRRCDEFRRVDGTQNGRRRAHRDRRLRPAQRRGHRARGLGRRIGHHPRRRAAQAALLQASQLSPDVIILDLGRPAVPAQEVRRRPRWGPSPVVRASPSRPVFCRRRPTIQSNRGQSSRAAAPKTSRPAGGRTGRERTSEGEEARPGGRGRGGEGERGRGREGMRGVRGAFGHPR